jgi:D-glycero-D-manno-heptose 1,7-bisphosphate phosphatase
MSVSILNNQIGVTSVVPPVIPVYKHTVGIGRDGVINELLNGPVCDPTQFRPIPGSLEAIALLRSKQYNIVILTNQHYISKGTLLTHQVDAVHQYMLDLFGKAGCSSINGLYYSTTTLKDDIYAKPNLGMFKKAEQEQKVMFKGNAHVGDDIADLKAAFKIGATPVLVKTGNGLETLEKLNTYANRELKRKTVVFENLWEFANEVP